MKVYFSVSYLPLSEWQSASAHMYRFTFSKPRLFFFFLYWSWPPVFGASSGARVSDDVLACSASKDIWNNSLTCNDAIGQRPVLRYSRQLGPQPRIIEQSSPLNGVGKFVKEKFSPPVGIEPVHFCIEVERYTNWATAPNYRSIQ